MIIIDYKKRYHKQIIEAAVKALKAGKAVAYPTDTSYGLAVDATNIKAINNLYQIKERGFNKPVHIIVPSLAYAKKITIWNKAAAELAKKFLPGPLTLVLELKVKSGKLETLSANTGTIGIRIPDNNVARDLSKKSGRPITATSANPPNHVGGDDSYSAEDIVKQFKNKEFRPDIIINAGRLPKRKPSTMVRVFDDVVKILREGPISEKQILKVIANIQI
ncbi:MAG: L-threonylcarbamoyladenylate synthase [Candidatus Doudnabacteria bacterium]|nr:L-threonylcarbamoyladenylate synthase [Candidatus Doudnabacteria bacterium]